MNAAMTEEVQLLLCFFGRLQVATPMDSPRQHALHLQPEEPKAEDYMHYRQNQLSPRSRVDYDAFNRAHFDRLHSAQGRAGKRAVTPKVSPLLNATSFLSWRKTFPF